MNLLFPLIIPDDIRGIITSYLEDDETSRELRKECINACIIDRRNNCTYKNGALHSFNDYPAFISYYENDKSKEFSFEEYSNTIKKNKEIWYNYGVKHRTNGNPSEICYFSDGTTIEMKVWYKDGLIHNINDQPASITYTKTSKIINKLWYKNGYFYRDDENNPHSIYYHYNGTIYIETWYDEKSNIHRDDDKPAKYIYNEEGDVVFIKWYKRGMLHRDVNPAIIKYYGKVERIESWFKNGNKHRDEDLPAELEYDSNNKLSIEIWYKNGSLYREENKRPILFHKSLAMIK
jgi:hypothetical protein